MKEAAWVPEETTAEERQLPAHTMTSLSVASNDLMRCTSQSSQRYL